MRWHQSWKGEGTFRNFVLSPEDLDLSQKTFTILIHTRPFGPNPDSNLLTVADANHTKCVQLVVDGTEKDRRLAFLLTFSARPEPLTVAIPLAVLSSTDPHQLLLRYSGYKVDFFVDGVLADEEWPLGTLGAKGTVSVSAGSEINEMGAWARSLSDSEITQLNGGRAEVARRTDAFWGPEATDMQYWKPRGYNVNAGDAMPFYHDGVFHLYYLIDRRHHRSKWGLGAHQWGHASTTDLVHWTQYPPALTITDEEEASICTGSVFFHHGKYYAFYATRKLDRSEHLGLATSSDGIHFDKVLPSPLPEPQPPFKTGPNRDPYVYQDGNIFRMLVTAELATPALFHRGGALEQLLSPDLNHWTASTEPFLLPGYNSSQPECSDVISWRGWHYLLFGQDGATHYRMSRTANGPWLKPAFDILDAPQAHVMKVAPFGADRQIGVAWVANGTFGGELLFRELTQLPDGTLGTKFVPEMIPAADAPLAWHVIPITSGVSARSGSVVIHAMQGIGAAYIDDVPPDMRVTARVSVSGKANFGIVTRGEGAMARGLDLKFFPALRWAEWLPVESHSLAHDPSSSVEGVDGLDRSVDLDMVVKGDIFDASINGTHTLVRKQTGLAGRRLFFYIQDGELTVSNLIIRNVP